MRWLEAVYARALELPLLDNRAIRLVKDGRVTDKIEYLTADQEEGKTIAQANAEVDDKGRIKGNAMVVGATGAIGSVCSRLLALASDELRRAYLGL